MKGLANVLVALYESVRLLIYGFSGLDSLEQVKSVVVVLAITVIPFVGAILLMTVLDCNGSA